MNSDGEARINAKPPRYESRRTLVFMLMNFFRSASMLIVAICVLRACNIAYTFIKSFGQATPVQNQELKFDIFSGHPNSANRIRSHFGKEIKIFNCCDSQCFL